MTFVIVMYIPYDNFGITIHICIYGIYNKGWLYILFDENLIKFQITCTLRR
jgi:hypothetical protein